MSRSHAYRISLLGLLPVIALVLYLEGQRYDPARISFESLPSAGAGMTAFFPDEAEGYVRKGQIRLYTEENLYEYVNGHAEYFIAAGFGNLAVGEYVRAGDEDSEPDVVVDIYDMERSIQAFGVLSDESRGRMEEVGGGVLGFKTPLGLSFAGGRYYVKISAYRDDAPVEVFAGSIISALGAKADPFPEFSLLPDIGTVTATRFIREAYRGLDFVNNVIEREYDRAGEQVQVFVAAGEKTGAAGLEELFTGYFQHENIQYKVDEEGEIKVFRVRDPYEGDWVMISLPDALFGIFGAVDDTIIQDFLKGMNNSSGG